MKYGGDVGRKGLTAAVVALSVILTVSALIGGFGEIGAHSSNAQILPTPTPVSQAFLPHVRLDPTPIPPPTPTPYWWDEDCAGGKVTQMVQNGGFEREGGEPWLWEPGSGEIRPKFTTERSHSGSMSLLFPKPGRGLMYGYVFHGVPMIGYAHPDEPGTHVRTARLRYWTRTENDTPADGVPDHIAVELWNCREEADGSISVADRRTTIDQQNPDIVESRNRWVFAEQEVGGWGWYVGSGRTCLTLTSQLVDDGTPADVYFDDVSFEVCTDS